jgi:hypothetical protein
MLWRNEAKCGRVGVWAFFFYTHMLPNARTPRLHLQGFLHGSVGRPEIRQWQRRTSYRAMEVLVPSGTRSETRYGRVL